MAPETAAAVKSFSSSSRWYKNRTYFMAQILLRIFATAFSLASVSVMAASTQRVQVLFFQFEASYSASSAWRFFFGVNIVACVLSVLSLICVCLISRRPDSHRNYFLLLLHDVVTMVLLVSGCAAATAIGYVGKYGESKMMWQAVCGAVPKFCSRSMVSLALSYVAFICYFLLTIVAAHKLMSQATTE